MMADKLNYKFRIIYSKAWAWHVGIDFCVAPKDENGEKEIYLLLCLGRHDISIGYLSKMEE